MKQILFAPQARLPDFALGVAAASALLVAAFIWAGRASPAQGGPLPPDTPPETETATPSSTDTPPPPPTATPATIPRIQKLPALSNLFLTHQNSPKLPPINCQASDDVAMLHEVVSQPITSTDPKAYTNPLHPFYDPERLPPAPQVLAAFEFRVRFDPKLVCVNLVPGPEWDDPGISCLVLDKDTSQLEGIATMACFSKKGYAPGNDGLHLADVIIRPQPDLYSIIRANQENGIVAQISNQNCALADEWGHPIPAFSCEDADVTIRFLEGDVNGDCVIDVMDGQSTAFRWNALLGALLYSTRYDLEPSVEPAGIKGDGDIDVKDVQFVTGRHNSTCADPNPPQPPVNPKM